MNLSITKNVLAGTDEIVMDDARSIHLFLNAYATLYLTD